VDHLSACTDDLPRKSLPAETGKREDTGKAVGLEAFTRMLETLPHDFGMADEKSVLDKDDVGWMVLLLRNPIAILVLAGKPIWPGDANEREDLPLDVLRQFLA